jgi:hypothetical protein
MVNLETARSSLNCLMAIADNQDGHSLTFHSNTRRLMPVTSSPVNVLWTKAAASIQPSPAIA